MKIPMTLKNIFKTITPKDVALAISATALLAGLALSSCNLNTIEAKNDEKAPITDSLLNSLLIDTVKQGGAAKEFLLTGKVTPDEDKMVKIYPMVSGIARDVRVQLGDVIKKGQTLAWIKSMEMASYAEEAASAEAELNNASRHFQVTEELFKSGLASELELEQAKNELRKAKAAINRSKAVRQINPGKGDIDYVISSPISGFVVDKKVTNNMHVRPDNAESLFTIADLSTVWILINVYESDISFIHEGDEVSLTTLSYPDKVFKGKIDKIYNMLNPENKVVNARVKVNNPNYLLKPEMFANVRIQAKAMEDMPVIHNRSLIFDNNRYYVIVADTSNNNKARIQTIEIGHKFEDLVYVKNGLKAGDRVIASKQLFLYESLKN